MKLLLPLLNGSLRADQAISKAGEKGDEIVLLYTLPAGLAPKVSFQKLLFIALCGNYILNYAEEKLLGKKVTKLFRYGDEAAEIQNTFRQENCELTIIEGWHPREINLIEALDLPKITILKRAEFPHFPHPHSTGKPLQLKDFGKKPLDQLLWGLNNKGKKPTPEYPLMPEDWENSLEGPFSSVFLAIGLIYEKELMEKILSRGKTQDNEGRFRNFSRRIHVLLKYSQPPIPKKKEWWAERDTLDKDIKPWCIKELLKKMENNAYLNNEERFFVTSFLGHHFHLRAQSIVKLFERNLIDYEPKIAVHNIYQILGLLDSHPYVVSDRFARTHNLCLHCDKYYGYCALEKYYREWVSRQSAKGVEKLSNF